VFDEHHIEKQAEHEHYLQATPRKLRRPLQPWILLLLLKKPGHGYDLIERLAQGEYMPDTDPGLLYRTLRQMEEEEYLRSSWDTQGQGPARRLYEVTPEGIEYLRAWAANIRLIQKHLARFLKEYESILGTEKTS
jgi:poly-beta-hydroxybutyrate-responsive repressor